MSLAPTITIHSGQIFASPLTVGILRWEEGPITDVMTLPLYVFLRCQRAGNCESSTFGRGFKHSPFHLTGKCWQLPTHSSRAIAPSKSGTYLAVKNFGTSKATTALSARQQLPSRLTGTTWLPPETGPVLFSGTYIPASSAGGFFTLIIDKVSPWPFLPTIAPSQLRHAALTVPMGTGMSTSWRPPQGGSVAVSRATWEASCLSRFLLMV